MSRPLPSLPFLASARPSTLPPKGSSATARSASNPSAAPAYASKSPAPATSSASSSASVSIPLPDFNPSSPHPQYWVLKLPQFVFDDFSRKLKSTGSAPASASSIPIAHVKVEKSKAPNTGSATSTTLKLLYQSSDPNQPTEFLIKPRLKSHHLIFADPKPTAAAQSNNPAALAAQASSAPPPPDPIFCGNAELVADVSPFDSPEYRAMLRKRLVENMNKGKTVKLMEMSSQIAQNPLVMKAQQALEDKMSGKRRLEREKESTPEKRVRSERSEAEAKVLHAFSGKQCMTQKELLEVTQEPLAHLKEIMRDLCDRITSGENAGQYQLKEQYRLAAK